MESELSNVTELLNGPDKKSKRYIPLPVSSSLPDHISSDFVLNRFNATSSQKIDAKKGSKKANESEILADENKKHTDGESENADQNEHETKDDDSSNESDVKQLAIVREDENIKESTNDSVSTTPSSKHHKAFGIQTTHLTDNQQPDDDEPQNRRSSFEPTVIFIAYKLLINLFLAKSNNRRMQEIDARRIGKRVETKRVVQSELDGLGRSRRFSFLRPFNRGSIRGKKNFQKNK